LLTGRGRGRTCSVLEQLEETLAKGVELDAGLVAWAIEVDVDHLADLPEALQR